MDKVLTELKKDLDAQAKLSYLTNVPVKPHSGQDWLRNAYEDALQVALKLKAALIERDGAG